MYFNSTIKSKVGLCPDCDHEIAQNLIGGRCPRHYKIHRHKVNEDKKKTREVRTQAINKTIKSSNGPTDLVMWYSDKISKRSGFCMECGEVIPAAYAHHSIAHILKKSEIPSVKTHPENCIELGAGCGCHGRFDHSAERASQMKVAKIAKERFKTFEHLIAPEERRRIPEWLLND